MQIHTVLITITVFFCCFLGVFASRAYAYGDVGSVIGSSIVIPKTFMYIDGNKIDTPENLVLISTKKPSFFGYTKSNVLIHLSINPEHLRRVTTSDSKGYWMYTLDTPLSPGVHQLTLALADLKGATLSATLAATFRVPEKVLNPGAVTIPQATLKSLNYATIPLIIFGISVLLLVVYSSTRFRKTDDE